MTEKTSITKDDLLEAIKRSGYLLESEIANSLAKLGFFVESNQVIEDPITGKSREIDLTAEYYDRDNRNGIEHRACAKVNFVFEIKNNIYPLVLMTRFEFSPNLEIWESVKEIETRPSGITASTDGYYDRLLLNNERIFTQYCSFEIKKSGRNKEEFFASHPEQVHSGLSKITQYCEEAIALWEGREEGEEYYRKFLYMPVLLINDDLFEMEVEVGKEPILHKVEESRLLFNYHYKSIPRLATVWVVTRSGFDRFIKKIVSMERLLEHEMVIAKRGDA